MIKVDISNVWGQIALPDLLAMEKEVAAAHAKLMDGTGAGNDFLGWLNLPTREANEEILRIQSAARKVRNDSDVFVVIGIGGSYLGPRAAIEMSTFIICKTSFLYFGERTVVPRRQAPSLPLPGEGAASPQGRGNPTPYFQLYVTAASAQTQAEIMYLDFFARRA